MRLFLISLVFLAAGIAAVQISSQRQSIAEEDAAETEAETITIEDAYAFSTTEAQKSGAVFMKIINSGEENDRLTSAEAEVAGHTMLHTNVVEQNTVMMVHVDGYDIPAGETVNLDPIGHHIMLMGLKAPLKAGKKFPITLNFEKQGEITTEVNVRNPTAEDEALEEKIEEEIESHL